MRVLVSGASGAIGSALCEALLDRGDEVVGLSRDPERARLRAPGVEWHGWEPTLERPPEAAFADVDGVVNLVGEKIAQRWTEAAKGRIMESRRTGTQNLVQAIAGLAERPAVLVSQSAVGYYGDRGDAILDEAAGPGDGFDAAVCREWERAAREAEAAGLRLAIVRTGHVLYRGGGLLGELELPFRLGLGGPLAGGGQYVSWIDLEDEVGILLWALTEAAVSGVVNATAPEPVTNGELARALGRALHRPARLPVPGFVLDLKVGSEFAAAIKGGQRVLPKRALELGYEFRQPDLEAALRRLY